MAGCSLFEIIVLVYCGLIWTIQAEKSSSFLSQYFFLFALPICCLLFSQWFICLLTIILSLVNTDFNQQSDLLLLNKDTIRLIKRSLLYWTVVVILAVDVNCIFPSRYKKVNFPNKQMGFMDVGIGMFIFSNALENSMYCLRRPNIHLLLAGLLRVVLVRLFCYQSTADHYEYGIVWNAFFTMYFSELIAYLQSRIYFNCQFWILISAIFHSFVISHYSYYVGLIMPGMGSLNGFIILHHLGWLYHRTSKNKFCILISLAVVLSNGNMIDRSLCNFSYLIRIVLITLISIVIVRRELSILSKNCSLNQSNKVLFSKNSSFLFFIISNIWVGVFNKTNITMLLGHNRLKAILFLNVYCLLSLISTNWINSIGKLEGFSNVWLKNRILNG